MESLLRDLRYGCRLLGRAPTFTTASVATLAVAIGINAAVFTVVDAVLLQPLPYPEPDRLALVTLTQQTPDGPITGTAQNGRTWEAIRDGSTTVQRAAFSTWTSGVNMAGAPGGSARHVTQQRVGAGFFATLGVQPMAGREFTADEDTAGGPAAAVLSAALFRQAFNGDTAILGRTILLRGENVIVVGVMPDGFQSGRRADIWTPLRASRRGEGEGENYSVVVRLRPGVGWAEAHSEISRIGEDLSRDRPRDTPPWSLSLTPMQEGTTAELRRPLLMLWLAVGIVWLVASINLAGLTTTRAASRAREMATRVALGSGRSALVRQLGAESVVLGAAGGALGVLLGFGALEGLKILAQGVFELSQPIALHARAVAAAGLLAVAASAVFGAAPALLIMRLDLHGGLGQPGSRGVAGRPVTRPRQALVVAQVALALVLLVAAGLLLRSYSHLTRLNPGFDPERLVVASISLEDARYRTNHNVMRLFDEALARMERLPGVRTAAVTLGVPYQRLLNLGFKRTDGGARQGTVASATYMHGDVLGALGLPLRRGRTFDDRDTQTSPGVAIVNESFVRAHYPDTDPIGRRIAYAGREREIVGIVGDVQVQPGWGDYGPVAAMPLAAIPASQASDGMLRLVHGWFMPAFLLRTSAPADAIGGDLRRALDAVDPLLPLVAVRPFSEVQAAALAPQKFVLGLVVALAGAALLLACVGLYALIATAVAERRREMGIRLALGSTPARAVRTLVAPGLRLAVAGIAIGSLGALGAARLLAHFVWGVGARDPLTMAGVALLLLVVAAAATLVPALRILELDPAETLRTD